MKKVIMIRYAELSTKKDNINYFLDKLESNVKKSLDEYKIKINKYKSRMYIDVANEQNENLIISKLVKIPGIIGISLSYVVNTDLLEISNSIMEILKKEEFNSFKVETRRTHKGFKYTSMEVSRIIGSNVIDVYNKKVDIHNPELTINVEIRDSFNTYIYLNEYKGLGGYPVGSNGRALLMMSGGIDSPVAAYLSIRRGISIDAIYFESLPHTSLEARNKVIKLCKILNEYSYDINLFVIPFTKLQEEIYKKVDNNYAITIMRRMMYRISEIIAKKYDLKVIINGESIGQVSSQTLSNISVINEVTNIPIIRPLACMDKIEIIDIAKRISTYDTSILPFEDCCTIFVPIHPVINPSLDKCVEYESKIEYEKLIDESISNLITLTISEHNTFKDLL